MGRTRYDGDGFTAISLQLSISWQVSSCLPKYKGSRDLGVRRRPKLSIPEDLRPSED